MSKKFSIWSNWFGISLYYLSFLLLTCPNRNPWSHQRMATWFMFSNFLLLFQVLYVIEGLP
uniref:Phenylalanyl-tRNA synthetase beta chain n=1 Tax=Rhizophora mucronata TaxID=61149 RepID=A0A2P2KN48_RHIMU